MQVPMSSGPPRPAPTGFTPNLIRRVSEVGARLRGLQGAAREAGFPGLKVGLAEFTVAREHAVEAEDRSMMFEARWKLDAVLERTRDAMRALKLLAPAKRAEMTEDEELPEEVQDGNAEQARILLQAVDEVHTEMGQLQEAMEREADPERGR